MFDDYVGVDSTPLYRAASGSSKVCHLLWGDGVRFEGSAGTGSRRRVRARGGRHGFVTKSSLGGASLLEFYFIDVGQGDGLLIKTPKFRHIMIDGGFPRSIQDTGKNAADFVDWKFAKDYRKKTIDLDAMLASHCDADHYGGLDDLLDVAQKHELDASGVSVEAFITPAFRGGKNRVVNILAGQLPTTARIFGRSCWAIETMQKTSPPAAAGINYMAGGMILWEGFSVPKRAQANRHL